MGEVTMVPNPSYSGSEPDDLEVRRAAVHVGYGVYNEIARAARAGSRSRTCPRSTRLRSRPWRARYTYNKAASYGFNYSR